MQTVQPLQPTLWRTCRVLANRRRLRMLQLLATERAMTVTAVAERLGLPAPVTSQYLRALEARGLLRARRDGSRVSYRFPSRGESGRLEAVLTALRAGFRCDPGYAEVAFRSATAFTHPRRIEIYRSVCGGNGALEPLCDMTKASRFAVVRHLAKLAARGFIRRQGEQWVVGAGSDGLASALAQLAEE